MDRIRDLCDLARDVGESVESLIRFGASGELAIYVIARDWPVRSKNDAEDPIREPVFLVAEDLHQSLNAECTTVNRVKRRIDDDPIMLLVPVDVARGAHYVTAEEAERFSREHALTLKSGSETPSYLNRNHDFYSTELATAVKAWMALFADGSFEPGGAGAEHAADEFIGPFGGGDVEDAGHHPRFDEGFHGSPTAAGGVKDEDFKSGFFENLAGGGDAVRCVPELAGGDDRFVFGFGWLGFDHTADRASGAGEDLA